MCPLTRVMTLRTLRAFQLSGRLNDDELYAVVDGDLEDGGIGELGSMTELVKDDSGDLGTLKGDWKIVSNEDDELFIAPASGKKGGTNRFLSLRDQLHDADDLFMADPVTEQQATDPDFAEYAELDVLEEGDTQLEWYAGNMPKKECETIVKKAPQGSFLVREGANVVWTWA